MQLKTVGESLTTLNSIENVINRLKEGSITAKQALCGLTNATELHSLEVVKLAISQSTLNEKQIRTILSSKKLKGEILETTTAELAQITTNNALTASQKAATSSTLGLGNAFKGVWATIKAHPIIAGLTAVISIGTIAFGLYNKHQKKDDLVSKYGAEASAIDIVNGKYDEQIKKLDTISRKKAQDFVNENSSNIKEDWNFLNDTKSINKMHKIYNGEAGDYNKYRLWYKFNVST